MKIVQNLDLAPGIQGFETAAANAFDVAFFTANWTAAFSVDKGKTFTEISPFDLLKPLGLTQGLCDQGVTYEPRTDTFIWVVLSVEGPIVLAVAPPQRIRTSKGREWTVYRVSPELFGQEFRNDLFDYPEVCFGDNFVYMAVNVGTKGAIIVRMPISEIAQRGTISVRFKHIGDSQFICPAQLTGDRGLFGTLQSDSTLRIFLWLESSLSILPFDVPIATVPTQDFHSFTPDNEDWLPDNSKIAPLVTGAARSTNELWLAWSAGRRIAGRDVDAVPQPHIEIAVISVQGAPRVPPTLMRQRYIWNPDNAWAWPSLASNGDAVAMSCAFGGRSWYPQHIVGILKPREEFVATASGKTNGSGGHYVRLSVSFPNVDAFVAGGWICAKEPGGKLVDHPHYVVFQRY